jgi:hypothetical protein
MANERLTDAAKHVVVTDITKAGQKVRFSQLLIVSDQRLRIIIESDSYKDQSSADVQFWNGSHWASVWYISHGNMSTPHGLAYKDNGDALHWFQMDRNKLFNIALEVLGVAR